MELEHSIASDSILEARPDTATICVSGSHDENGSAFIRHFREAVEKAPLDKRFSSILYDFEMNETTADDGSWSVSYSLQFQKDYLILM